MEEENDKLDGVDESEETLTRCVFTLATGKVFPRKEKSSSTMNNRLPRNFNEACPEQNWAAAIDREFQALEDHKTWKWIQLNEIMKPLPLTWNFRIKETSRADAPLMYNARCCLRGDEQVVYRDYDPEALCAPVSRY